MTKKKTGSVVLLDAWQVCHNREKKYPNILKMMTIMKTLVNEIFDGVASFALAFMCLRFVRMINFRPENFWARLLLHLVEVIVIYFVLRRVLNYLPVVFPNIKGTTRDIYVSRDLYAAVIFLLIDWSMIDVLTESLHGSS